MSKKIAINPVLALLAIILAVSSSLFVILPAQVSAADIEKVDQYTTKIRDKKGQILFREVVPGSPPPAKRQEATSIPPPSRETGSNSLTGVPTSTWAYGCSATAAAMLAGYYDQPARGYTNIYTGAANAGVFPLNNETYWDHSTFPATCGSPVICGNNPLAATKNGVDGRTTRGHVDDYWHAYTCSFDPYRPATTDLWTEHTADCTGDFMGTSQWVSHGNPYNNTDGSTVFYYAPNNAPLVDYTGDEPTYRDGNHGVKLFLQSRGYTVTTNYYQCIYGYGGIAAGFTYTQFKTEIDAGRPVFIHLIGHTMLGVGYSDPSTIYVHDTWDNASHAMTWGTSYSGMTHRAVSVFQLAPPTAITIVSPNGGESWSAGNPYNITWSSSGSVGSAATIALYKGGTLNTTLTTSASMASGSYSWAIPSDQTPGSDYRIQVSSTSTPSIYSQSASNFSITAPGSSLWLIGAPPSDTSTTASWPGWLILDRWPVTTAGSLSQIQVNCAGPGNIKVAVYSDAAGNPGNRLAYSSSTPVTTGWKSINLNTTVTVSAGQLYWLAFMEDSAVVYYKDSSNRQRRAVQADFSSAFPLSASGVVPTTNYDSWYNLLAGYSSGSTPPVSTITVTAPNGGENWQVGSSQTITWSSANVTGNVSISLSTDAGSSYPVIISASASNTGSYAWTVPNNVTTQARVKVTSVTDTSISDTSNSNFTISAASGTSQQLLGAVSTETSTTASGPGWLILDQWPVTTAGSLSQIQVNCAGPGNIKVAVYSDAAGNPGNRLAYSSSTPVTTGWKSINLNTTVTVSAGQLYWLAFMEDSAVVYYKDSSNRQRRAVQADFSSAFPLSASGVVPTTNYDSWYNLLAGYSSGSTPPVSTITVTAPNGGENWQVGSSQTITWSSANVTGNVSISLSTDAGSSYPVIISASASNTGSYAWTVPNNVTTQARVKVTSVTDTSISDTSNSNFTISAASGTSQQLLGAVSTETSTTASGPGWLILDRWPVTTAGSLSQIQVNCAGPGNIKVAVYSDAAGNPGNRLAYSSSTPVTTGWKSINLNTTVTVSAGQLYWLAFMEDSAVVYYKDSSNRQRRAVQADFSSAFPLSASGVVPTTNYDSWYNLLAGYSSGSTPPVSTITVTAPNGGENWQVGSSQTITWSSANVTGNVSISLSTDAGSSYPVIISASASNTGSYAWTVPNNVTTQARVKVTSVTDTSISDTSNSNFTISAASGTSQQLLGAVSTETSTTASGPGWLILDQWPVTTAGSLSQIQVNCAGPGNIKVAVYSDAAGNPGNRLAYSSSTPVTTGWKSINLNTTVTVSAGQLYWLAFMEDSAVVYYKDSSNRQRRAVQADFSSAFPLSASGVVPTTNYDSWYNLLAGYQ